jgi:hypothetical protein
MNSELPKRVSISFDESIYHQLDMMLFEQTGLSFVEISEHYPESAYDTLVELVAGMPQYAQNVESSLEGIAISKKMDGNLAVESSIRSSIAAVGLKASELTAPVEVVLSVFASSSDKEATKATPDKHRVVTFVVGPR